MELSDVTQVIDLNKTRDVNKYLVLGWKLIQTYVVTGGCAPGIDQDVHYVMAWQGPDPKHPAPEDYTLDF